MSNTYSFLDVQATLVTTGAVLNLGAGAAVSEEGITVSRNGDKNSMTIGADGEGMHSLHADKSGTVTVRLLKTSPTNAKLMALYAAQSLSSALWGANVITITNPQSGDVITCRQAAFKKAPDIANGKDAQPLEWTFDVVKVDSILGVFGG